MVVQSKSAKAPQNKLESARDIFDHERLAQRIAEGADVNARIGGVRSGTPPIELAAGRCDVTAVRMLLAAGATPEWGKSERGSALKAVFRPAITAGETAAVEICELLVQAGANPNGIPRTPGAKLSITESPIYSAAMFGLSDVIVKLHSLGADINAESEISRTTWSERQVNTALGWVLDGFATGNDATKATLKEATIVTLLRLGADEKCLEVDGTTAFQRCVALGFTEVVEYYVTERGEDLAQRVNGRTLAQHARTPEMRQFLKSLKSMLEVEVAVDAVPAQEGNDAVRTKRGGLAL
jgi:hypothetical protein